MQKCDGGRPVCRQCVKMNRSAECEYDDATVKSRTQKLLEKLSGLEGRLRELESDPQTGGNGSASSSSMPSPASSASSPSNSLLASFGSDKDPAAFVAAPSGIAMAERSWPPTSFNNSPTSSSSSVDLTISGLLGDTGTADFYWPPGSSNSSSSSELVPSFFDALGRVNLESDYDFSSVPAEFQPPVAAGVPQWDPKAPVPAIHKTHL